MLNAFPARACRFLVSDDGTLRASAQHLSENFMRIASAEPPPYRPLDRCLARKKISQKMRNNQDTLILTLYLFTGAAQVG